jgi:serine/threonine-protein kinase
MTAQTLIKVEEVARQEPVGPGTLDLHYEYARLLEGAGRKAEAIAVYDSILAVRLDYGDVLQRLKTLKAPEPPPPPPVAQVPAVRFEVFQELDRGGQGVIRKARDRILGRTVALKSLRPDGPTGELLGEARSIAALQHPNIVTLFEVFEQAGEVHLVLEFLEGETLLKRIGREGPLAAPEAARVGKAMCAALDYAHARGLVHRDVKPSNVMLLPDGQVKVLDFGLAKTVEGQEITSTRCGTPFYMAPEQILCRRPDGRTDVYGLGATLYQALTGEPPFTGEDVFYQHLNRFPTPARSRVASVPMKLDFLVLRCLEKKPEDRPASAREVAEFLDRL